MCQTVLFDECGVEQTHISSYVNLFIQHSRIRELCNMKHETAEGFLFRVRPLVNEICTYSKGHVVAKQPHQQKSIMVPSTMPKCTKPTYVRCRPPSSQQTFNCIIA